jgi:hypothetical protein
MPRPVTVSADDVHMRLHSTRPGYVLITVDTADGRHFEHAVSRAELDDRIAKLKQMRPLLEKN